MTMFCFHTAPAPDRLKINGTPSPKTQERNANLAHETNWVEMAQGVLQDSLDKKQPKMGHAKNLILFIGDGMGVAPITAARWHKMHHDNTKAYETHLAWDHLPVVGHSKVGIQPFCVGADLH